MGFWSIVDSGDTEQNLETAMSVYVEVFTGVGYASPNVVMTPFGLTDGALFQRRVFPARTFTLVCSINGSTFVDTHTKREALYALVDHGTGAAVKVRYTNNSQTLEIEAHYTGGMELGERFEGFTSRFPLQFVALDPYWENTTVNTTALTVNSPTVVTNNGAVQAWPTITLAGEGQIDSLANSTNSKTITFTGFALFTGETVTIDLSPGVKNVSSDVRGNLFNVFASGSDLSTWALEVGSNSVTLAASADLELLVEEDGDTLDNNDGNAILVKTALLNITTADLKFRNRYLSIDGVG